MYNALDINLRYRPLMVIRTLEYLKLEEIPWVTVYILINTVPKKKINLGHGLAPKLECKNYTYMPGGTY